jgi:hypothetical protein
LLATSLDLTEEFISTCCVQHMGRPDHRKGLLRVPG